MQKILNSGEVAATGSENSISIVLENSNEYNIEISISGDSEYSLGVLEEVIEIIKRGR